MCARQKIVSEMHFHLGLRESVRERITEVETLLKRQRLWLKSMNFVKLRSEGSSETEGLVTEPRKGNDSLKRGLNSKEALNKRGSQKPCMRDALAASLTLPAQRYTRRNASSVRSLEPAASQLWASGNCVCPKKSPFLGHLNLHGINWTDGTGDPDGHL